MFLETMKWPEVDKLDRDDVIAACCISALEQHSLHLPLGTDYVIGSGILRRLEELMPNRLLCLPTVWLGCSSHHLSFAGTMSASTKTMHRVIRDVASSIIGHGFGKILFLNSHGGNRAALACSIQELGHEFPDAGIVGATYWEVVNKELSEIRDTELGGMGHACELETSIMLALAGELVDMSKAEQDGIPAISGFSRAEMLADATVNIYKPFTEISHHGGYGDPRSASAQKGERFLGVIVTGLEALCGDLLAGRM